MTYVLTTNQQLGAQILTGAQPFVIPSAPDYDDARGRQRTLITPDQALWREFRGTATGEEVVYTLTMLRPPLMSANWRGTPVTSHRWSVITEQDYYDALECLPPRDWQANIFAVSEPYNDAYGMTFWYYFAETRREDGQKQWRVALSSKRFKLQALGITEWLS